MHLQLFGSDEPVSVIQPDGIDAKEIEERYAEYPTILEEEADRNHGQRHIHVSQDVKPDDAVAIALRVEDNSTGVVSVIPHPVPMAQHQRYGRPLGQQFIERINLAV